MKRQLSTIPRFESCEYEVLSYLGHSGDKLFVQGPSGSNRRESKGVTQWYSSKVLNLWEI